MAYDFPSSPTNGQTYTPAGGQTYTWDAAGTKWTVTGTGLTSQTLGNRNLVINGDFSVDQRNSGAAPVISGPTSPPVYTLDRWALNLGQTPGAAVMFQQLSTNTTGYIGEYQMVVGPSTADATLAAGDYYRVMHKIEGNMFRGANWGSTLAKPITVSFDVTGVNGPFTLPISFANSAGNRRYTTTFVAPTAGTRVTLVIPGDTTGTWLYDTGIGLEISITLGAGSTFNSAGLNAWGTSSYGAAGASNFMANTSNALYLKDFQVELGSLATPFERIPYMDQLARCQRYYWKKVALINSEKIATGAAFAANQTANVLRLPVKMRGLPTMIGLGLQLNNIDSTGAAFAGYSDEVLGFHCTVAAGIAANDGVFVTLKAINDYIYADAEY